MRRAGVDQFVDQARAFCRAVLDQDSALAIELARAIAEDSTPIIESAARSRERILAGDAHSIRLTVRLLELLLPAGIMDDDQVGSGGER